MSELELSIIVVSFNTRELTRSCLQSISDHCHGLDYELITVDNASDDGSSEMVASDFPQVRLLANTENLGFARANNQAFELAAGRFVLLVNPDTEVRENTVQACLEFADTRPDAGAIGCRVEYPNGDQQNTVFRYLRPRYVFINAFIPNRLIVQSRFLGRARYVGLDVDQVQEVECVAGCFILLRRKILDQVGGMDDDFFMYGEEAEWCFRIRRAGWKNLYFPGATLLHYGGKSTEQSFLKMTVALCQGQLLFIQKTQGAGWAWLANLLMLCRDLPRVGLWGLSRLFPQAERQWIGSYVETARARFGTLLAGLMRPDWRSERPESSTRQHEED